MKALRRTKRARSVPKQRTSETALGGVCEGLSGQEELPNRHSSSQNTSAEVKNPRRLASTNKSKGVIHDQHELNSEDASKFTSLLLEWYSSSKRDLPWRTLSPNLSLTDRAYAVLVSEVMLQQTQVVTVRQYYEKWMSRWPTFQHLSEASLEDVNTVWAGLGYYGRAKRLWEAARKVSTELGGEVPLTSSELQSKLPGVGRYTAGAVASIAFGEKAAAVDGNVIRVLARVRCLGADCTSKVVMDHVWKLSEQLVPVNFPGNFNQAMMDLGATVCTPRKPSCSVCPVSSVCLSYMRVQSSQQRVLQSKQAKEMKIDDIEEVPCALCFTGQWDSSLGVMNFPRKAKKAPPRNEVSLVCVVYESKEDGSFALLLAQRPENGLLAGLWEFPSLALPTERSEDLSVEKKCVENDLLEAEWKIRKHHLSKSPHLITVVTHIFSHIRQQYVVYAAELCKTNDVANKNMESKWIGSEEVASAAISTAMKKVYQAFCDGRNKQKDAKDSKKRPRSSSRSAPENGSKKMTDYFRQVVN